MRLDFRMFRCLCWKTRPRNISNLIFYSTKPHWSEKGDATETWGLAEHFSCKGWEDEAWRTPWQSVAGADGCFLIAVASVGVWRLFSDESQKILTCTSETTVNNHNRDDEAGSNLKLKTADFSRVWHLPPSESRSFSRDFPSSSLEVTGLYSSVTGEVLGRLERPAAEFSEHSRTRASVLEEARPPDEFSQSLNGNLEEKARETSTLCKTIRLRFVIRC